MSKMLGDSLQVKVGKPGDERLVDLGKLFNDNPNRIIAVLATVGADGGPHTCPVSLIYAADDKTLLLGMLKNSLTSANLARDGRVCLQIMAADDVVMGIKGVMRPVRDPMEASPAMALWEMQVSHVKLDTSPAQRVTQGVAADYRNDKARAFGEACFAELRAAAGAA
ncbi:MAG: hypothetical protein FJ128_03310 [Deltaproteobacteria bacterium]|nr:hypothetical protein [Deltaproteobacteria bacterium]